MSDDIDRAQDEVERNLAYALRSRRPLGPEPTGLCSFCESPLGETKRWCDAECRDQWEVRRVRS